MTASSIFGSSFLTVISLRWLINGRPDENVSFNTTSGLVLLSAAASCKEKQEPTPEPEPEVNAATFTATLDASAATPFKTSWTDGDAIHLIGVKDGKSTSETITASSVSSASATFTSKGSVKDDCDEYYAFIAETGVSGCDPLRLGQSRHRPRQPVQSPWQSAAKALQP